jgi:hypothetical protein
MYLLNGCKGTTNVFNENTGLKSFLGILAGNLNLKIID